MTFIQRYRVCTEGRTSSTWIKARTDIVSFEEKKRKFCNSKVSDGKSNQMRNKFKVNETLPRIDVAEQGII